MQLLIKQRVFSWTDSYDVYDETGEARYFVKAELFSFGHQIHVYDKRTGKALADLLALEEEDFTSGEPFELFDPENTWKRMTICEYEARKLLVPIFVNGELVYESPSLTAIAAYAKHEKDTFWDEYKRLNRPHRYKVDLSQKLYDLKHGLLADRRK